VSKDRSVRDLLLARPGEGALLPGIDTASTPGVKDRNHAEHEIEATAASLAEFQDRLWAEHRRSLLLVLQGMDTSGKDGTIKHVFKGLNPLGVDVAVFKKPTEEELAHDFLWRIERRLPQTGEIVIFNRSHYEDVVTVRVLELAPEEVWRPRFDRIVSFEQQTTDAATTIVKVFLHISYDEQRERLLARLEDPDKHWKFNEQDIEQRAHWAAYQAAYEEAIGQTHTAHAPWYIVPADKKWYRNWAVARLLNETFGEMDPRYPRPELDVEALKERLAPPN
jgi:PPK2 family polyphosphate:nucleotide phosphotransferase